MEEIEETMKYAAVLQGNSSFIKENAEVYRNLLN